MAMSQNATQIDKDLTWADDVCTAGQCLQIRWLCRDTVSANLAAASLSQKVAVSAKGPAVSAKGADTEQFGSMDVDPEGKLNYDLSNLEKQSLAAQFATCSQTPYFKVGSWEQQTSDSYKQQVILHHNGQCNPSGVPCQGAGKFELLGSSVSRRFEHKFLYNKHKYINIFFIARYNR